MYLWRKTLVCKEKSCRTSQVREAFDLEYVNTLRSPQPTSARRIILLKGYQHWAGRALVGLRALAYCADLLKDYEIVIYSPTSEVEIAAELIAQETNLNIRFQPPCPRDEMLKLFGRARVALE